MVLGFKWDGHGIAPTSKARGSLQKRGRKTMKSQEWWLSMDKRYLSDTTELLYTWTHRSCDGMHKTCARPSQPKPQRGLRRGSWNHTLAEEPLATEKRWERKSRVSLDVWPMRVYPCSRRQPCPHAYTGSTQLIWKGHMKLGRNRVGRIGEQLEKRGKV